MSSRLPPALLYLTIYNPTLKPSDPIVDDDDAEEQAHILFYTSRERAVSRDKMLRQVGLAKALVNFSEMFASEEDACDNVHSHSRRMLMVSPEPGFWIHACLELAKTPAVPPPPPPPPPTANKGKGKAASKAADKGKHEGDVVYDYHEGSVHDVALRAQVLQGYEEFKLTHGSFASILGALGRQALELQLERFFTVWAWKWDIQESSEFGGCIGVPLHPSYKPVGPLLDDFVSDHPFLEECAPFVLAHSHLIPSSVYSKCPPPPALSLYVRSRLGVTPTLPLPATSSEPFPTSKAGTDLFVSGMNATREAMEATGHAFVAIGASMDVRKWGWPGYLTFSKGVAPPKTAASHVQPATDAKKGVEEKEPVVEAAAADGGVRGGERVPPSTEANLRGDVDRESLHEAMSTDSREGRHEEAPPGEENASTVHSTSQIEERAAATDATSQTGSDDSLQDEDESGSSPPASPSTPVVRPPSPTSLSSSLSTLPDPVPAPSFRSFSLHFSSHDDLLATAQRRVLYITKEQLTLAFLEPTLSLSEDDNTSLYQTSSALLANVQGLIDHDEASNTETPITAAKILQPKDQYLIAMENNTATVTSADFASRSEHLFNGSQMIINGDAIEVFSRTQGPQHWHVGRREPEGTVYLEVFRKETSLADVENELSRHLQGQTAKDGDRFRLSDRSLDRAEPSILQTKRTRKVGVTGKYGTRYGASLRKQVKKDSVKRQAVGIWKCRGCKKVIAGGAWTVSTTAAATVRSTIRRLRDLTEA
ncbi:hypothetical protein F5148DRAFT_1146839 [Russula earlei]|uniref:Uncharacterized protein n=1 Tax=Russula earlei TaxID=71964 RepID=A0ACC0UK10_9AGAM|nr:hypothetical protein F5148DRAFT_1146839 [Russula earlei]